MTAIVYSLIAAIWIVWGVSLLRRASVLRERLTILTEDCARLRALLDESVAANVRLIALNDKLLGLSVKLVTESDTRCVILPPPGGMVA